MGKQEEKLKAELALAKKFNKPALLHVLPMDKTKWIERNIRIANEVVKAATLLWHFKVIIPHYRDFLYSFTTDFKVGGRRIN